MKEWNFSNYKAVRRKNKELKALYSEGMIIDPLSIPYTSHFRDRFEDNSSHKRTRIPPKILKDAVKRFCGQDPYSNTWQ